MNESLDESDYLDSLISAAFVPEVGATAPSTSLLRELGEVGNAGAASEIGSDEPPETFDRYEIVAAIGRGGVGTVYRAIDRELGRSVALKVCRGASAADPDLVRRFVEEARIASRLQHPGIVPIHDVGTLPDGRPYFAMKLVEGTTLDVRQSGPMAFAGDTVQGVERFLRVVEAVAYAHDQGVVHGDLKPQNVMIGAFGEILVVDWGFARVDAISSSQERVLGTPSYMAPEQATGRRDADGKRTDVFGLGAILVELLCGRPVYEATTRDETLKLAAKGDQSEVRAHLNALGAPELCELALRCIAPDPAQRYADGVAVAAAVHSYLTTTRKRARDLELESVAAAERARADRRRRRLVILLAATIVTATIGIAWSRLVLERDRAQNRLVVHVAFARAMEEARSRRNAAFAASEQGAVGGAGVAAWDRAVDAAKRAETAAENPAIAADERAVAIDMRQAVELARSRAKDLAELLVRLEEIKPHFGESGATGDVGLDYTAAFLGAGIDLVAMSVAEAAAKIGETHAVESVCAGLDDFATLRQRRRTTDAPGFEKLVDVAIVADPDPWRQGVRGAWRDRDLARLRELAADAAALATQPVRSLAVLARAFVELGAINEARAVYALAAAARPGDYWLHHDYAYLLDRAEGGDRREALRQLSMALVARPDSAHVLTDLGLLAYVLREHETARLHIRRARALEPDSKRAAIVDGLIESARKDRKSAIEAFRTAVALGETAAALPLSQELFDDGRVVGAIEAASLATGYPEEQASSWLQLGRFRLLAGDPKGALDAFDEGLRRTPDDGRGLVLRGVALVRLGREAEGVAEIAKGEEALMPTSDRAFLDAADAGRELAEMVAALREVPQRRSELEFERLAEEASDQSLVARLAMAEALLVLDRPLEAEAVVKDAFEARVPFGIRSTGVRAALAAAAADPDDRASHLELAREWLDADLVLANAAEPIPGSGPEAVRRVIEVITIDPRFAVLRTDESLLGDATSRARWVETFRSIDAILAR